MIKYTASYLTTTLTEEVLVKYCSILAYKDIQGV